MQPTGLPYRAVAWSLVIALAAGTPALAQDERPAETQETRDELAQESLDGILAEFDAAMEEFQELYFSAETDEQRQEAFQDLYPQPERFAPRLFSVAEEFPDSPAAVEALVWVAERVDAGSARARALDLLVERYVESEELEALCSRLQWPSGAGESLGKSPAERFLRAVLEKNPSPRVRGSAALSLGVLLCNMVEQGMDEASSEEARSEAERLLELVLAEYGAKQGLAGLESAAKGQLFELRSLAIGKVAPDIVGADLDGVEFKLSDYRGKVVVLDFWGDW